ncbi:MAG TPA: GGDEF domain-containing protein [Bryobacteraceae bacterium]|nr:GGDEF domain-containing protein [Bryobacteraceae bacterium]
MRFSIARGDRPAARTRAWLCAVCALFVAELAVLSFLGRSARGPLVSDLIQLTLGSLCVPACLLAAHRSGSLGRYFWRLMTVTFAVWAAGQIVDTYSEFVQDRSLESVAEILFVLSTTPLGMALFLDPDNEPNQFDRIHILDFVQALLFWCAVYLYFLKAEPGPGVAFAPWKRSMFYDAVLTGAFFLRAALTNSGVVRALFGRMFCFLLLSSVADAYATYPGRSLRAGGWFDIVWMMLTAIPLTLAVTWNKAEAIHEAAEAPVRTSGIVVQQFFPLLYPGLILALSPGLAKAYPTLAAIIAPASFACFSARLIITQRRLQLSQAQLREANRQLARLSSVDGLTGVANRRIFDEALEEEWRRAARGNSALAVIMIDIDHFKALNDSLGHARGDECLIRIAAELKSQLRRAGDLVARFGGEEFVLLLPGMGAAQAADFAEVVRRGVEGLGLQRPESPGEVITASFGVAAAERDRFPDAQALLRRADWALYGAKRAGRNRVVCADDSEAAGDRMIASDTVSLL